MLAVPGVVAEWGEPPGVSHAANIRRLVACGLRLAARVAVGLRYG
jgi:hypothetical protein